MVYEMCISVVYSVRYVWESCVVCQKERKRGNIEDSDRYLYVVYENFVLFVRDFYQFWEILKIIQNYLFLPRANQTS